MSTPRFWLGISNREWLINSNTPQLTRCDGARHLSRRALNKAAWWGGRNADKAVFRQ